MAWNIYHGDCREVMAKLHAESVDAVICDPPYGLSFMGKEWDSFKEGDIAMRRNPQMDAVNTGASRQGGRQRACADYQKRQARDMLAFQEAMNAVFLEALRVAKPGAHLLAFGGTRTYHRLACAIEDAGWEIRDCVMWVYGSGFPKSLNVSKAIDKQVGLLPDEDRFCAWIREHSGLTATEIKKHLGSDRFFTGEMVFVNTGTTEEPRPGRRAMVPTAAAWAKLRPLLKTVPPDWVESLVKEPPRPGITHPGQWQSGKGQGTSGTNAWEGWGTALKPSHEPVIVARKPLPEDAERATIVENLSRLESQLCLLMSDAWLAEASLMSSRAVERLLAIARWTAVDRTNTRAALCGQMDTSQCELAIRFSLNTVRSWRSIWEDGSVPTSTFITATGSSTTIGWQTLKSCVLDLTLPCIIRAASEHGGSWPDAVPAAAIFNAVSVSTNSIRTLSAHASAIEQGLTPRPDAIDQRRLHRPIIVARKPLCGTVAENVLKHGTGGINVDGCRVGTESTVRARGDSVTSAGWASVNRSPVGGSESGRWPANVIHDGSDEVVGLFPQTSPSPKGIITQGGRAGGGFDVGSGDGTRNGKFQGHGDSGSAARFFYCAKASKADRDEGCEGLAAKSRLEDVGNKWTTVDYRDGHERNVMARNHHPTVKPTALMRYLCRLVTPPGGVVLDPFTGSGSTGKAAILEGFRFIGIEREAEYVEIAKARIAAAEAGAGPLFAQK